MVKYQKKETMHTSINLYEDDDRLEAAMEKLKQLEYVAKHCIIHSPANHLTASLQNALTMLSTGWNQHPCLVKPVVSVKLHPK